VGGGFEGTETEGGDWDKMNTNAILTRSGGVQLLPEFSRLRSNREQRFRGYQVIKSAWGLRAAEKKGGEFE